MNDGLVILQSEVKVREMLCWSGFITCLPVDLVVLTARPSSPSSRSSPSSPYALLCCSQSCKYQVPSHRD